MVFGGPETVAGNAILTEPTQIHWGKKRGKKPKMQCRILSTINLCAVCELGSISVTTARKEHAFVLKECNNFTNLDLFRITALKEHIEQHASVQKMRADISLFSLISHTVFVIFDLLTTFTPGLSTVLLNVLLLPNTQPPKNAQ